MTIQEIDFSLIESKAENKVFKFTNSDGTVYDMTDSTAACLFYKDGPDQSPISIACTIEVSTGKITVPFTDSHTDTLGTYEYVIEETKVSTEVVPLVKGNIAILEYVPFSESIEAYLNSELPANLTLTMDYRNQRIMYWRRVLQSAFEITDANLNIESAWPTLVNALLAKLVVYDALILAAKGGYIQFMGGDYTSTETIGGGGVKSVETGPVRVEYFDTAQAAKNAVSAPAGGNSMIDEIKAGICGLAGTLGVKIHICPDSDVKITPRYYQNPDWDYPTLDDMDNSIEAQPSQG